MINDFIGYPGAAYIIGLTVAIKIATPWIGSVLDVYHWLLNSFWSSDAILCRGVW